MCPARSERVVSFWCNDGGGDDNDGLSRYLLREGGKNRLMLDPSVGLRVVTVRLRNGLFDNMLCFPRSRLGPRSNTA